MGDVRREIAFRQSWMSCAINHYTPTLTRRAASYLVARCMQFAAVISVVVAAPAATSVAVVVVVVSWLHSKRLPEEVKSRSESLNAVTVGRHFARPVTNGKIFQTSFLSIIR